MPASDSLQATLPDALFAALSSRQAAFLAALITATSIEAAARQARVASKTAHRWLKMSHFDRAYACVRKHIVVHALAQIELAAPEAVQTIKDLLANDNPTVQIYAAKSIMDMALKATLFDDHEQRLQVLEEGEHASDLRVA
jgi:hypothetical protein